LGTEVIRLLSFLKSSGMFSGCDCSPIAAQEPLGIGKILANSKRPEKLFYSLKILY
jgi:hypothetical protein